jgi:hypothetical protein
MQDGFLFLFYDFRPAAGISGEVRDRVDCLVI